MCYSAMIEADYATYVRMFGADITIGEFVQLFWERQQSWSKVRTPRNFDRAFANPKTAEERMIKEAIDRYDQAQLMALTHDLHQQRERLQEAERKLQVRETKAATESKRIASKKIRQLEGQIHELLSDEPRPEDSRIFPRWFAPVMIWQNGRRTVVPMRYQCRPNGRPEFFDDRFPGTYNARRDSLEGYWKEQFGHTHGLVLVHRFFENVSLHHAEGRELQPGEKERNAVIEFRPNGGEPMLAACLWSRWESKDKNKPDLLSFALITDEPPPEVRAAGHDRCIIPIKHKYIDAWLNPEPGFLGALYSILDDREPFYYQHRLVSGGVEHG